MICENCGEQFCYLNRYCSNCSWDRDPEREPPEEPFDTEPVIDEVTKETLERFINIVDQKLEQISKDNYKTKQHLIDEWHEFCSYQAERYDLETRTKYYELAKK